MAQILRIDRAEDYKMTLKINHAGFTLVEVMITVSIIGVLATLALPHFGKARSQTMAHSCRNNLRMMEAAKQQAAMEMGWGQTDGPTTIGNPYYRNTCSTYIKGGERPVCPSGASCYYNGLNEAAACQSGIESHTLIKTSE